MGILEGGNSKEASSLVTGYESTYYMEKGKTNDLTFDDLRNYIKNGSAVTIGFGDRFGTGGCAHAFSILGAYKTFPLCGEKRVKIFEPNNSPTYNDNGMTSLPGEY